jgi:hypothetical protein
LAARSGVDHATDHQVVKGADDVEVQGSCPPVVLHDCDVVEPVTAVREGLGDDGEVACQARSAIAQRMAAAGLGRNKPGRRARDPWANQSWRENETSPFTSRR